MAEPLAAQRALSPTGPRQRRTRRRRRRIVLICVLAAVTLAGGGAAWAMSGSSGPSYRLATVETGALTQTLSSAGTISAVNQATVAFPVAGQIDTVDVKLGQKVRAGQTLATLSTTDLDQQVQSSVASVASAQQTLAQDETSQTSAASSSSTGVTVNSVTERLLTARPTGSATPSPSPSPRGGGSQSLATLISRLKKAQQAVVADQKNIDVDTDIIAADKAIVAENTACQSILADQAPAATTAPPAPAATTPAAETTSAAESADDPAQDLQGCQSAIAAVQSAQKQVQHDEDTLAADEKTLNDAVTALLPALNTTPAPGSGHSGSGSASPTGGTGTGQRSGASAGSGTGSTSGSGTSGSSGSGSGRSAATTVITAEQLAADQKQIDAANAQLAVAQQDRAAAVLTAPISGTVGALSLTNGASVQAGSTTSSVTVIGPGSKAVTTTVGINDVDLVKGGDRAQITVDGVAAPLPGRVTYVGVLNTSGTSGSTSTYPVTVLLDPTATPLFDGAAASVAINVGSVNGALTVPISALHQLGSLDTVDVYANGKLTVQRVTVGVAGVDRVQITSGLTAGQRVVLANISAPIPSNTSVIGGRRFTGAGAGGLGGSAVLSNTVPGSGR